MNSFLIGLISDFGYFGIFLGMVLEAVIIVIPSEAILAFGGILAGRGVFSFWGVFITGLLGSVFCAIIIYLIGYFGGYSFIKKYGKYFFMKEEDISKSNSVFNKYGLIGALVCRNFPIVRTLISLPIGIYRLSFIKFVIYTFIGSIPWTFVFVYLGYKLGDNWTFINNYLSKLKIPIIILLLIIILSYIHKFLKKKKFYFFTLFF